MGPQSNMTDVLIRGEEVEEQICTEEGDVEGHIMHRGVCHERTRAHTEGGQPCEDTEVGVQL